MPKRYWWIIATFFFVQFGVLPVAYGVAPYVSSDAELTAYSLLITSVIGFIVTLLLLRKEREIGIWKRDRGASTGESILWIFLGVVLALTSQMIAAAIETYIFRVPVGSENTAGLMNIYEAAPLFVLYMVFFAPVFEELIFRKIIFGQVYKKTNFFIAGIVSSLAFAVLHMDFTHLLIYTSMGFVFAFLYVRTQRIIIPILVHGLMNLFVVVGQSMIDPEMLEEYQEQLNIILLQLTGGF
ncbi:CPBP family intramembrane glutamic endopeptidase [Aureibacillus halotolerans]|uniref:CAAX prenyl protease 2/Lysostaphin resistance protein A-like domain-containing protein n=1 Tax=Aureibacillus halotolerans TaxID=1508390 RepID=A0A4R6TUX9_9BACI|nr:type II CAAX endopeptidase family protein [Aureibacillus halotolerans]TDQ35230.1 hypothetical protein EV213_12217 [Aureibacillus halotolerans]